MLGCNRSLSTNDQLINWDRRSSQSIKDDRDPSSRNLHTQYLINIENSY